jgi:hypothetical protein
VFHGPHRAELAALGGVGVLAAITAGLVVMGPRTPPAYTPRIDPASVGRQSPQPVVLVIGDDLAAATDDVAADQTFVTRACTELRWICNVDAQPGTGYLAGASGNAGDGAAPYEGRLAADEAQYLADAVVVLGGANDVGIPGNPGAAARRLFLELRRAYPKARIAVVEPVWTGTGTAPRSVVRLRAAVQGAAEETGVRWIDSDTWVNRRLVAADGTRLTPAGHRALAAEFADVLRSLSR